MRFIKNFAYALFFALTLFFINNKVLAFSSDYILTEDDIYNFTSKEGINLELKPHILCYLSGETMQCYFFNDEVLNNIEITKVYSGYQVQNKVDTSLTKYSFKNFTNTSYINGSLYFIISNSNSVFTNIEEIYNITGYNVYKLNIPEIEEKEELEITNTVTEILNQLLDKSKNIYESLIGNQFFVLCLGVMLSYLVFIILYKFIRK